MDKIHVIEASDASVLLWDGDGIEVNAPDVSLTFNPDLDGQLGRQQANLSFGMSLGVLGHFDVIVDVPLPAILAWAELVKEAAS